MLKFDVIFVYYVKNINYSRSLIISFYNYTGPMELLDLVVRTCFFNYLRELVRIGPWL
jgi:hypothetical protein